MVSPRKRQAKPRRIGIIAGAFDPVHAGHVAFALQALERAGLDEIIFLPERRPRQRPDRPEVEHYAHRTAMLNRALEPHPRLKVVETLERNFTVARTLPTLQTMYAGDTLVFVMGSEVARSLQRWQHAERLLTGSEIIIGARDEEQVPQIIDHVRSWQPAPLRLYVMPQYAPEVSSGRIREALRDGKKVQGLLDSVGRYARREWLYVWPEFARQGTT